MTYLISVFGVRGVKMWNIEMSLGKIKTDQSIIVTHRNTLRYDDALKIV